MIALCPRCGAEFPFEVSWEFARTSLRCPDCSLAPTEPPAMLAPSRDEIAYDLGAWPVTHRTAATAALIDIDVPYRWEVDLALAVPAMAKAEVDRLLDEVEAAADQDADTPEAPIAVTDDDGGEEAQAVMGELFLAADRLQHAPWDEGLAKDFPDLAAAARTSLPPYGIERSVWSRVQTLSADILSALGRTDDEAVAADARTLRELLRNYV
jgi:hypothetical protein